MTRFLRVLILVICFSTSISEADGQVTNVNRKSFQVPDTRMEIRIGEKSYSVLKNGVEKKFQNKTKIRFRKLAFDPLAISPNEFVPELLKQRIITEGSLKEGQNTERAYIVQFKTQAFEGYQKEIKKFGGKVYTPIHDQALIIILSDNQLEKVRSLPYVRWVGVYHPSFKLEESLKYQSHLKHSEKIRYSILLLDKRQQKEVVAFIHEIGGEIELKTTSSRFEASLNGDQLLDLVNRKEVLFIDKWTPTSDDMDVVRSTQGINFIETVANYTGQGVNGEVADGGVHANHIDFRANPPLIHGKNDESNSHGTPVFGIVFGSGAGNGSLRGILPDAKTPIFSSRYHIDVRSVHTNELVDPDGPYRAVFQTNSWGSDQTKDYTTMSAELDQIAFNTDLLILQSQSNEGDQMSRPQAWAKNVVSVGGIRHYNTATRTDDAWSGSASIGPASDGRIKPDLSNFYDFTRTAKNNGSYKEFSGTSSATPVTAGHFGLLFQMWAEGVFAGDPSLKRNVFDSRPHMSTAKAIMINMAEQYEFSGINHDLTRVHQGWGLPNIRNVYQNAKNNNWHLGLLVNETDILLALDEKNYEVSVDGKNPLKVTLVYTDPAGTPGASKHLINDLNLKVVSPDGVVYWGNHGLNDGNWSIPEGEANHLDNVENIFIKNPMVGNWQVSVIAEEIIKDSHVETEEIDADYALVVSGNQTIEDIEYFSLNINFNEGDSIILDPPGGHYASGEVVVVIPKARTGFKFIQWNGDFNGSSNPLTVVMDSNINLSAKFVAIDPYIGNIRKFNSLTNTENRRAMPFISHREGKITRLSMYHNGGDRKMILGVYDGEEQTPINLIGTTEETLVSPNDGWQSIDLIEPVHVDSSQKVWLAWIYENNPGIYYDNGSPGRVESGFPWSNKMPVHWGDTARSSSSIYSIYANLIPVDTLVARITGPSSVSINTEFQLSADSSIDPHHEITAYFWDFGDGTSSELTNPAHTYVEPGSFKVSLKITNDQGHVHTSVYEIIVTEENILPIAEANGPYTSSVDSALTFTKAGSFDPDGFLSAYFWNFGDGNTSSMSNPTHTYTEAGEYEVTLTVADQKGKITSDTALVSITDITLSDGLIDAENDELLIYPNPVSASQIKFSFKDDFSIKERRIRLMNLQGSVLKDFVTDQNKFFMSLDGLSNGIYLVTIQTHEQQIGTKIILLR